MISDCVRRLIHQERGFSYLAPSRFAFKKRIIERSLSVRRG
jgi:hypothetical protein